MLEVMHRIAGVFRPEALVKDLVKEAGSATDALVGLMERRNLTPEIIQPLIANARGVGYVDLSATDVEEEPAKE